MGQLNDIIFLIFKVQNRNLAKLNEDFANDENRKKNEFKGLSYLISFTMRNDKENLIVNRTLLFAVAIIEFAELLESKRKFIIANQILKSGTSIGANVREAQNAESKADLSIK